jgi:hypothetical protein
MTDFQKFCVAFAAVAGIFLATGFAFKFGHRQGYSRGFSDACAQARTDTVVRVDTVVHDHPVERVVWKDKLVYVPVTDSILVEKHDTTYIEKMSRDSIYMHDSIYIHEYTKGDTVYMERDRWHYGYKDKLVHDSIYISQRDTIVNVESITVPAAISGWQWFQIYAGRIALVLVLIGIVILIVKHKY